MKDRHKTVGQAVINKRWGGSNEDSGRRGGVRILFSSRFKDRDCAALNSPPYAASPNAWYRFKQRSVSCFCLFLFLFFLQKKKLQFLIIYFLFFTWPGHDGVNSWIFKYKQQFSSLGSLGIFWCCRWRVGVCLLFFKRRSTADRRVSLQKTFSFHKLEHCVLVLDFMLHKQRRKCCFWGRNLPHCSPFFFFSFFFPFLLYF